MTRPKAYSPELGYRYQILAYDEYNREYDHLDYAKDKEEKDFLLGEYRMFMSGLKVIQLPEKYWR